jgi:hypothetical protein
VWGVLKEGRIEKKEKVGGGWKEDRKNIEESSKGRFRRKEDGRREEWRKGRKEGGKESRKEE